jgi:hypothetical protein
MEKGVSSKRGTDDYYAAQYAQDSREGTKGGILDFRRDLARSYHYVVGLATVFLQKNHFKI